MSGLFEDIALEVSKEFGFIYNFDEAHKSLAYAKHIRTLPKDAKEII